MKILHFNIQGFKVEARLQGPPAKSKFLAVTIPLPSITWFFVPLITTAAAWLPTLYALTRNPAAILQYD